MPLGCVGSSLYHVSVSEAIWGHLPALVEASGEGGHPVAWPLFFGSAILLQYRHVIKSEKGYSFPNTPNIYQVTSNTYMGCGYNFPTGGWEMGEEPTPNPHLNFQHFDITTNINENFQNSS